MLRKWRSRRKKIRPPAMKSVPFQSRIGPFELLENRFAPAIVTWDGGGGDFNWNTPTNWNTDTLPGAADDVTINVAGNITVTRSSLTATINSLTCDENLALSGGSLTINTASSVAGTLTVTAGTLTTVGTFTGTGPTVWQGGTLGGSGDFNADGGLTISTATGKFATGKRIKITVGAVWTGGDLALDEGAILEVPINQMLDGQSNNNLVRGSGLGTGTINNLGTIRKSAGGGTTTIGTNVSFANAGTVQAQNGTISLNSNGTHTGSFSISAGAILAFGGGTQVLGGVSTVSGAGGVSFTGGTTTVGGSFAPGGTINISGGTATVNSALAITGALNISSGSLAGTGDVTVAGAATWSGGTLGGGGQLIPNGGLNISGTGTKFAVGRLIRLGGGAVWTGGDLALDEGAILEVPTGQTFNPQSNNSIVRNSGIGSATVNLAGSLVKTAGSGTTNIAATVGFVNSGNVRVQSGSLTLPGGGTHLGTFQVDSGATLDLSGSTNNLTSTSALTGGGDLVLTSGSATFNCNVALGGKLTLNGGTTAFNLPTTFGSIDILSPFSFVGGTGNVDVTGITNFRNGTISGSGYFNSHGGLEFGNIGSTITIDGKSVTFSHDSSPFSSLYAAFLYLKNGATLSIASGEVLGVTSAGSQLVEGQTGAERFINYGTIYPANTVFGGGITFENYGTINVNPGFTATVRSSGVNAGNIDIRQNAQMQFVGSTNDPCVFTHISSTSITGAGTVSFLSNSTNYINGNSDFSAASSVLGGKLIVNGSLTLGSLNLGTNGTIDGVGNVSALGVTSWSSGEIRGSGTFSAVGGINAANGGGTLSGKTLSNQGTAQFSNSSLLMQNGATFINSPNATINVGSLVNITTTDSSSPTIINYGVFRATNASGTFGDHGSFSNLGTVDVTSGTMTIGASLSNLSNGILAGGTFLISGTLSFPNANIVTNAAIVVMSSPVAAIRNSVNNADALASFASNSSAASFSLSGNKNITVPGLFTNAGTMTIASGSTFATASGDYSQSGGTTTVNGILDPAGNFNLSGGVLFGSGNVLAPIIVFGSGQIAPGNSPGILNATQGITLFSGSSIQMEVNQTTPASGHDQLNVTGLVNLGGAQLAIVPGFAPLQGETITIVNNDASDPIVGIFNGLPESAIMNFGSYAFSISYVGGTGNDVVLTATQADLVAPYIVDIVDVAPDPRTTPVSTVDVVMSEVVNLATFTSADVVLLRDGNPVAFSGNESVSFVGGMTYRINGLSEETASGGGYILIVNAAGIQDLAANQGTGAATDIWTNNNTDSTAPTIVGMFLDGTTWTPAFRAAAGNATYGYPAQAGAGQLTTMPWSNLNTVYVKFSENVNVDSSDLGIRGINVANYAVSSFSYDNVNFVAKWVLTGPIDTDRVIVDLDGDGANAVTDIAGNKLAGSWTEGVSTFPTSGAAGSDFKYRFVVAVGDADRNGLVRNPDTNLVRANLFVDAGQAGYNIYADIDGNGVLRNADLNAVRSHLFTDPPAGPGPNRPVRGPNRRNNAQRTLGNANGYVPPPADAERRSVTHRRLPRVPATDILDSAFAEL